MAAVSGVDQASVNMIEPPASDVGIDLPLFNMLSDTQRQAVVLPGTTNAQLQVQAGDTLARPWRQMRRRGCPLGGHAWLPAASARIRLKVKGLCVALPRLRVPRMAFRFARTLQALRRELPVTER